MTEKISQNNAVRRSTEREILIRARAHYLKKLQTEAISFEEGIILTGISKKLGYETDLYKGADKVGIFSERDYKKLIEEFGPLRESGDLETEDFKKFLKRVSDSYFDGRRYEEFNGVKINADLKSVETGKKGSYCNFNAYFLERIGAVPREYKTQLFYYFEQDYDDKETPEEYVSEQLKYMKECLEEKLIDASFRIERKSLLIE